MWRRFGDTVLASSWRSLPRLAKIPLCAVATLLLAPTLLIVVGRFVAPPVTPLMLIRSAQGYRIQRQWVPLRAIAPEMRRAVIVAEDNRFCGEFVGVDFQSMDLAIHVWTSGGRPTGASTITMQTARNLFEWPGRSLIRKLAELWITPQLALLWPRRRVLEVYLNIVEFGPGLFGVQAAARHYFGKNASQLNVIEATRLAAVLPNPLHWSPNDLGPEELKRASMNSIPVFYGDPEFRCSDR
ncbi:MAG TPA: monofunctional biosynthetic peptidoglycan transglycosylase [Candidatus Binataceae bacterium]